MLSQNQILRRAEIISRVNNFIYSVMDNSGNNVKQIQNYTDREFYEKCDRINRILCNYNILI